MQKSEVMGMANEENLISNFERTPKEREELARKAGIASGRARREKKAMRDTLEMILGLSLKKGKKANVESVQSLAELKGKNISVQEAIAIAMAQRAMKGDVSAVAFIRDTTGQKPTDKVEMSGEVNNPLAGLSTEELKKLVDDD